jgi:hypothetical protein
MKRLAAATITLAATLLCAAPAHAQTDSRFAIGVNLVVGASDKNPTQDAAHSQFFPELLWRFGDIQPGWGPHWGLNWYSLDIDRPVGGSTTTLGELHIRPIMAGYGYTWINERDEISINGLAGYAFDGMSLSSSATDAYQARMGVRATDADASNVIVFRPELNYWRNINRLFGLNVNVGYMIARPTVTVTTSSGVDRRTARADQFQFRVGLVYSIF